MIAGRVGILRDRDPPRAYTGAYAAATHASQATGRGQRGRRVAPSPLEKMTKIGGAGRPVQEGGGVVVMTSGGGWGRGDQNPDGASQRAVHRGERMYDRAS